MHIKPTLKLLSTVMLILAGIMLIPAIFGFLFHENQAADSFLITALCLGLLSSVALVTTRKVRLDKFSQKDGFLFTVLTWLLAAGFGACPLVFSGTLSHFSDAFFEIVSGFTTTGATRLSNIEACAKCILLWRSMTNWLGGMGIVVLFVSILPAVGNGAGAFFLMGAETVGPVKSKLTPKTRTTAIVLWAIYLGITLIQILLLLPTGIGLFDCVTISFSTVSTAGFSVKNASIGAYDSAYIDAVVTVFMILAAINFSLYFKLITGNRKEILRDTELKTFLVILLVTILTGTVYLTATEVYATFAQSLRYMAFHVASIISTTGFVTANYSAWPTFAVFILVLTMFIGGCAGSTGGGMKVSRLIVAFKAGWNTIKRKNHPNAIYNVFINKQIVPKNQISEIMSYIVIYLTTWLAGAFIVSLTGMDIQSCLSSSILTLGNIGAGFGNEVFSTLPHWTNWIYSLLMIIGRLELFTVFALLIY